MKIFIVGASGRVGKLLVKRLVAAGHEVYAGTRHADQDFGEGVTTVAFDLHDDTDKMATAFNGMDAIYFVAGSRSKDLLQTDAFGPVKVSQAAKAAGVKRFILLSSLFATEPDKWNGDLSKITNYNIAKFFGDHWVIDHSQLDYTILQPGTLKEEAGTGRVTFNDNTLGHQPIEDVVGVLVAVLTADNTIGKVLQFHDGDDGIESAVAAL